TTGRARRQLSHRHVRQRTTARRERVVRLHDASRRVRLNRRLNMSGTLEELRQLIKATFDIDPSTIDPAKSVLEYGLDPLALPESLSPAEDRLGVDLPARAPALAALAGLAGLTDRKREAVPAAAAAQPSSAAD